MTRPDGFGGSPFAGAPQPWTRTASYPNQPYPDQSYPGQPYPGQPYPSQSYPSQSYRDQSYPDQSYPGQLYPGQSYPGGQPRPPYPPPPGPWPGAGQHFAPPPAAPRQSGNGPSSGKLVAFVLVGLLLLALFGGGVLMMAGSSGRGDLAAPVGPVSAPAGGASPASSNVTVALPPTIDGRQQIDNPDAKQLVDGMREQLAATASADAVVGLYGNPDQSPAFLVAASTTTYDSGLLLTGLAAGMQQSAAQGVAFVDQPAGPLGGTMRCAETDGFTVCLWGADGTFGMNMVYNQNLADAAATTLRVREAVEIHSA